MTKYKDRTQEDVCGDLVTFIHNDMEQKGFLDPRATDLMDDCIKLMRDRLQIEILNQSEEDDLLLVNLCPESLLEEAVELNTVEDLILAGDVDLFDVVANKENYQYSHQEISKIIERAEELKSYLPKRRTHDLN